MKSAVLPNSDLGTLQQKIDYHFQDISLLELALTHESYSNEHNFECGNNERLEFLGDSVLGMIICLYLYKRHPKANEGRMAQVKGLIASTSYLADKARVMKIGEYLKMGRGELLSRGYDKSNVLADVMEAVIGAIYLDGGFEPAQRFVLSMLKTAMDNMEGSQRDYKSLLQEFSQKSFHILPIYQVVKEEGPAHDRFFQIEVSLAGKVLGSGEGHTKQNAGQIAAEQALRLLRLQMGFDLEIKPMIILDDPML